MSSPQEQFAAAVRSTQAQAVDAVETWTKITQEAFGKIGAEVPTTAPNPDQVIDQVFDFAEKMLEGQRDFAKKMLGMSEKVGEATRDELESAGEKIRGQVESGTEAARKQVETFRGQVESGTEAARKQAEALREQIEARTEAARKQAKSLSAPLADIAGTMTKTAQDAVPGAAEPEPEAPEAAAEEETAEVVEAEWAAESAPGEEAEPKPKRRTAKKADAYDGWTKPQLQEELVKRGLPKSGNVPELRERLLADD